MPSRYPWSSGIHTQAERTFARSMWSSLDQLLGGYDDVAAGVAAATVTWCQEILSELIAGGEATSAYSWWHLERLRASLGAAARSWEAGVLGLADAALTDSWGTGEHALPRALQEAGVESGFPYLDLPQLHLARQHQSSLIVRISASTQVEIDRLLERMVLGREQPQSIAVPIGKLLDTSRRAGLGSAAFQAERVVRTEGMRVFNWSNYFRGSQLAEQVPGLQKQWVHGGGGKDPRDYHRDVVHKKTIPWLEDFDVLTRKGVVPAYGPHDPNLPPDAVINCTCTLLPVMPEWAEYNKTTSAMACMMNNRSRLQQEWVKQYRE